MPDFYITINDNGDKQEVAASDVSTGATDAGKIVALNAQGVVDDSMLSVVGYKSIITNVTGNYALDISTYNKFELTLLDDTAITYDTSGMDVNDTNADITIVIRQSTGGHTPSFEYGTLWPGGDVPNWSTASGARDVLRGFHIHTSSYWYMREEGYAYTGVILGVMNLVANAVVTPVGSFVKYGNDDQIGRAYISAAGSLIQPAASDMTANAVTTIVGSFIRAGNSQSTGSAFITAAGSLIHAANQAMIAAATTTAAGSQFFQRAGAVDMTVTATTTSLGGLLVGGSVNALATAAHSGTAEVYLFVEGVAPLSAIATTAPNGSYIVTAPTALAATATVTAAGSAAAAMSISLTDSTNPITDGATIAGALGADFTNEGMTLTITGGTAPYTYTWKILQLEFTTASTWGSMSAGCGSITSFTMQGDGYSLTSCGTAALNDNGNGGVLDATTLLGNSNGDYRFEIELTVTDSNSTAAVNTAITQYRNIY